MLRPRTNATVCQEAALYAEQMLDVRLLPLLGCATRGKRGTFLEMGAYDGLRSSNSLLLERCFGWHGLLVEASPTNFEYLRRAVADGRRSSAIVHTAACAAGVGHVELTEAQSFNWATGERIPNVANEMSGEPTSLADSHKLAPKGFTGRHGLTGAKSVTVSVPCSPLKQIMQDAGHPEVTLLSLECAASQRFDNAHLPPIAQTRSWRCAYGGQKRNLSRSHPVAQRGRRRRQSYVDGARAAVSRVFCKLLVGRL